MGGFQPTTFRSVSDNTNHCAIEAAHKWNFRKTHSTPATVFFFFFLKQQRFGQPAGTFIRLNDKETRTDQDIYTREAHI